MNDVDEKQAETNMIKFREDLLQTMLKEDISSPDRIANADQFGLYWKKFQIKLIVIMKIKEQLKEQK